MNETICSLEAKLNKTIDSETEKESEIFDRRLVMECCDGLLRLGSTEKYILTARQIFANKSAILGKEIRDVENKNRRKIVRTILIAAIIAVLLAVAALGYAQVKYDILHFSDHSIVMFGDKNNKKVKDFTIGYVPEGFELIEEDRKKGIWKNTYEKDDMFLVVAKSAIDSEVSIDTEFEGSRIIEKNGIDYIIYGEEASGHGMLWTANNYMYTLVTNIPEEEMLKTAFLIS